MGFRVGKDRYLIGGEDSDGAFMVDWPDVRLLKLTEGKVAGETWPDLPRIEVHTRPRLEGGGALITGVHAFSFPTREARATEYAAMIAAYAAWGALGPWEGPPPVVAPVRSQFDLGSFASGVTWGIALAIYAYDLLAIVALAAR